MDNIKISVIVPLYNSEKYIRECLNSLVHQSLEEIEIIVIDDMSTDNSYNIAKTYEHFFYPKVKVFRNEKNLGVGATRNRGLLLTSGEYISFVDSDDYIRSRTYADLYNEIKRNNYPEIVTFRVVKVTGNQKPPDDKIFSNHKGRFVNKKDISFPFYENPAVWNKLFRKDIVKKIPFLEGIIWEDVGFAYSHLIVSSSILLSPNFYYFYRDHGTDSITGKLNLPNTSFLDIFEAVDQIEDSAKKYDRYKKYGEIITRLQISYALASMNHILNWPISGLDKLCIFVEIDNMIFTKYGNFRYADNSIYTIAMGMPPEFYYRIPIKKDPEESKTLIKEKIRDLGTSN